METSDLQFFLAVARAKSMSRASEELLTVQSNISSRIRALENEVGVPLFLRHARGVSLTSAGEKFLPYAERVGRLMQEGIDLIGDIDDPSGRLAIGSMETTAGWRLPELLAAFTSDCPRVDLVLETGPTAALVQGTLDSRLHGAFVAGPVAHPDLREETVFVEELVLVSSRNTPDLERALTSANPKALVFRSGCNYRRKLLALLASRNKTEPAALDYGSLEGILGCVAAGMGVTILPRGVVSQWAADHRIAVHTLPEELSHAETTFVWRTENQDTPAMSRFLAEMRKSSNFPQAQTIIG
ncbi:LysR family transcriptional regulator [Pseudarthrobacter sp. CC12]|uniref:LysR family transcriptional regulator n=1 Tax=Pseudarthrobacter sp. CC12 TaxID=3029193 RepID=UPI003263746A